MSKKVLLTILAIIIIAIPIVTLNWINQGGNRFYEMVDFYIDTMTLDEQGNVWVCYHKGFGDNKYVGMFQDKRQIASFKILDDDSGFCNDIVIDKKGNVWITQFIGGSKKFDGKDWTKIPSREFNALSLDKSGRVWVISENKITVYEGEASVVFDNSNSPLWEDGSSMEFGVVEFDNKNQAWISNSDKLYIYDGINWKIHIEEEFVGIDSITFDKDGLTWITSGNSFFLFTFDGNEFNNPDHQYGRHPRKVNNISFDTQGGVWILEGSKLKVLDDAEWKHYMGKTGTSMIIDNKNQIWLGGQELFILPIGEISQASDSILTLLIADGEFWLIVAILICLWLAYALNSWKGIGLGTILGAVICLFTISESLRTSSSGQSPDTLFPPDSFSSLASH